MNRMRGVTLVLSGKPLDVAKTFAHRTATPTFGAFWPNVGVSSYGDYMTQIVAGWYEDGVTPGVVRWWDGQQWTDHMRSLDHASPVPQATSQSSPVVQSPAQNAPATTTSHAVLVDYEVGGVAAPQPVHNAIPVTPEPQRMGFFSGKKRGELSRELAQLRAWIDENGLTQAIQALEVEKQALARAAEVQMQLQRATAELQEQQQYLIDVRARIELQEVGVFDFDHPAETSVQLADELARVRREYKDMARAGNAVSASSNFTFNNSQREGEKFVKQMSTLLLRAYNAEAENVVKGARAGNLESSHKRLLKAREQVEKNGAMISLRVTHDYHRLRVAELELAVSHLKTKKHEKELEREHRAELREQRRVEAELRAAREKLLKEQSHYQNLVVSLRERGDEEGLARAEAQLEEIGRSIADVEYREAHTRAGYVYVVSNVGSFGEGVVKIGMTRRLDPMDRVNELGGSSVPFRYDVHALFFSQDAVSIETKLHRHFSQQRINKVNMRREFFAVTPEEVKEALAGDNVELVDFQLEAEAEEFSQSRAITEQLVQQN